VVERAVAGFEGEIAVGEHGNYAAAFSAHLRPGLPVLFELARQSIQGEAESEQAVQAAVPLFLELVERVGRVARGGEQLSDEEAAESGGTIVMSALVDIFSRLFEAGQTDTPRAHLDAF
jgi:hypothetical protein